MSDGYETVIPSLKIGKLYEVVFRGSRTITDL